MRLRTLNIDCFGGGTGLSGVGRVWPVTIDPATMCAEYGDGSRDRRRLAQAVRAVLRRALL